MGNEVMMNEVSNIVIPQSLNELAKAINAEYDELVKVCERGLFHARNIGGYLLRVKEQLDHGAWLPWLAENCPQFNKRTVQKYMKIAKDWTVICSEAEAKNATMALLTINQAINLIPFKIEPVSERYQDWWDTEADQVWDNAKQARAFRQAVMIPDIMDKLATEDLKPLAISIKETLEDSSYRDLTYSEIMSEVKQRHREQFGKLESDKRREQEKDDPKIGLTREYREFEESAKKAKAALLRINSIKTSNPELQNANCGFAESGFHIAKHELNLTMQERGIKVVTEDNIPTLVELPQLPEVIKDISTQEAVEIDRYQPPFGGLKSKESGADGKFFAGQITDSIALFNREPRFEVYGRLGHLPSQYHSFVCGNLYRGIDGLKCAIEYADKMKDVKYPVHVIYPEGWDGHKPNPFHSFKEYKEIFLKPIIKDMIEFLSRIENDFAE